MITKPTRIIFGAGASESYGYPLGNNLLQIIHSSLGNINGDWILKLRACGIDVSHINKFRDELYLAQPSSVDSFLEYRNEFIEVGKLVIALSLIPQEEDHKLFGFSARSEGC